MKWLLMILLIGCGTKDDRTDGVNGVNCYDNVGDVNEDNEINSEDCLGNNGNDGNNGEDGEDGSNYVPVTSLEGYYTLPSGGYIELIENEDKEIIIYGTQRIYTTNFDTDLALHPNIPTGPHDLKDGVLLGEYNSNYNSTTNDVERDGLSSNISGVRKTFYKMWLTDSNKLKIQLIVYSSNGLSIDVNRTIESN